MSGSNNTLVSPLTPELEKALKENNVGVVHTILQKTDKTRSEWYQRQLDNLLGFATSKEMVDVLLENGISMRSDGATSLLCKSISSYNKELALHAIEKGANVNARCRGNPPTPLSCALRMGDEEIIRALLAKGVDETKHPYICETGMRLSSMRILIEAGFNPNVCSEIHNGPPLFQAILSDRVDIAKYLIDNGANVNIVYQQQTPLFYATGLNRLIIAQYLIQNGADLRFRGHNNITALELALEKHYPARRDLNLIPMIEMLTAKDPESARHEYWENFRTRGGVITPQGIARAAARNAVSRRKTATIAFALHQMELREARRRHTESQELLATAKTMLLSADAKARLDTIGYRDYTSIPQPPTVQNYVNSVLQAIDLETRKLNANTNVQYANRKHTRRTKEQEFKAQLESINAPNDESINTCIEYLELQIKDRIARNQQGGNRKSRKTRAKTRKSAQKTRSIRK